MVWEMVDVVPAFFWGLGSGFVVAFVLCVVLAWLAWPWRQAVSVDKEL